MIDETMDGEQVTVKGWINEVRNLGGIKFIILRTEGQLIQITLPESKVDKEIFKKVEKLGNEDVITVKGTLNKTEKSDLGIEIIPEKINTISKAI